MMCLLKRGWLDSYRISFEDFYHDQTMESALMLAVVGKHILAPKLGSLNICEVALQRSPFVHTPFRWHIINRIVALNNQLTIQNVGCID